MRIGKHHFLLMGQDSAKLLLYLIKKSHNRKMNDNTVLDDEPLRLGGIQHATEEKLSLHCSNGVYDKVRLKLWGCLLADGTRQE